MEFHGLPTDGRRRQYTEFNTTDAQTQGTPLIEVSTLTRQAVAGHACMHACIHTHTHTHCVKMLFLNVAADGTYSFRWALNGL
jgi:hypothetical protein